MKRPVVIVLIAVFLLAGMAFILYPTLSDYWNKLHQSSSIVDYAKAVNAFEDDTFDEMWEMAVRYNEQVYDRSRGFYVEDPIEYDSVLNVTENGMMAYIDIPKINVHLPIFHTVEEGVLQSNAGHVESSSLPVGGENSHCVISGHTGLPSARLFTDLDMIHEGDVFTINTLGVILTYEVDQVIIVLPWELDELRIVPGMDYCTLITCTPYGVNSHRLLIRGHRIETTVEQKEEAEKTVEQAYKKTVEPFYIAVGVVAVIVLVIIIFIVVRVAVNRSAAKKAKNTEAEKDNGETEEASVKAEEKEEE